MVKANEELAQRNNASNARLAAIMDEERLQQATEREVLMSQISALISSTSKKQQDRVTANLDSVRGELGEHGETHSRATVAFVVESQLWSSRVQQLVGNVIESRDGVKTKIKSDFAVSSISKTPCLGIQALTCLGC
jgi:kinesin family protein 11